MWWLIALTSILVILWIFCKISPSFQYKLKFTYYVIHVSVSALVVIPLFLLKPKDPANMHLAAPLFRFMSPVLGIQWDIFGKEILTQMDEPCVVVCNHQSMLDILGMAHLWVYIGKCSCVAKKEILYVFPFGLGAWLSGTVYINRSDSNKARVTLSTTGEQLRKNKTKLWIFPEGTRHKGPKLLPFKKGAFHIAKQHELPIVPVVISPYTFVDDDKHIFGTGKMRISVLPKITSAGKTVDELLDTTYDVMSAEFDRLSKDERELQNGHAHKHTNGKSKGLKSS